MQIVLVLTISLYVLSSAAYFAFLFFQREKLQVAGCGLLLAGFICHCAAIGLSFAISGHVPVSNMHETLSVVAWALVGAFLLLHWRFRLKILGAYAAPLAAFILIAATRFPQHPIPDQNILKGFWLIVHIVTIFFGDAAFALAAGVGVLYLLQERSIKSRKTRGFFFKRLPSLELLDSTGYACIVTGFTLLTVGMASGMIYAKNVWGHFWTWDPKEVWSAITWIFYAILLHERLTVGWRGSRSAIMSIIGLGVLLFTFLGVNLMLKGHHGQFTQF
jgi:cytochrome c-type biogenesis protein CcsB